MLTDQACKNASCPADKARVRLTDSGGRYLDVAPNGSKRWFWKYYFVVEKDGQDKRLEKRLALGSYPDVSLKAARTARDDARKVQHAGTDPARRRKLDKLESKADQANTFEAIAREYHGSKNGHVR